MRRFIILLLLCVLPLQFALAGAVDAFEHANEGHAEHSHAAVVDTEVAGLDTDNSDDLSPRSHADCGHCHFFHSIALFGSHTEALAIPSAQVVLSPSSADHTNRVTAQRPERPKWLQLA